MKYQQVVIICFFGILFKIQLIQRLLFDIYLYMVETSSKFKISSRIFVLPNSSYRMKRFFVNI